MKMYQVCYRIGEFWKCDYFPDVNSINSFVSNQSVDEFYVLSYCEVHYDAYGKLVGYSNEVVYETYDSTNS